VDCDVDAFELLAPLPEFVPFEFEFVLVPEDELELEERAE
jgi:hypothetical protein